MPSELVAYALAWYPVPGVKLVSELLNVPVPLPSLVQLSPVVGFGEVLQHTPLAVTGAPPSAVTLPPHVTALVAIFEIDPVVTIGGVIGGADVVNDMSFP